MSALGSLRQATAKVSVNLRGDLAKLSDAELAERLEAAWQTVDDHQARARSSWWFGRGGPLVHWRGPLRHPRIYRFLLVWSSSNGGLIPMAIAALIAAIFSGPQYERFLRRDPEIDEYLSLCEIRDIMDEIKRRLAQRKSGSS